MCMFYKISNLNTKTEREGGGANIFKLKIKTKFWSKAQKTIASDQQREEDWCEVCVFKILSFLSVRYLLQIGLKHLCNET